MTRDELLSQLHEEVCIGFPAPWHPVDFDASQMKPGLSRVQADALERYIDFVADLLEFSTDSHGRVIPIRKEAA